MTTFTLTAALSSSIYTTSSETFNEDFKSYMTVDIV
jgi:hypothetical protein